MVSRHRDHCDFSRGVPVPAPGGGLEHLQVLAGEVKARDGVLALEEGHGDREAPRGDVVDGRRGLVDPHQAPGCVLVAVGGKDAGGHELPGEIPELPLGVEAPERLFGELELRLSHFPQDPAHLQVPPGVVPGEGLSADAFTGRRGLEDSQETDLFPFGRQLLRHLEGHLAAERVAAQQVGAVGLHRLHGGDEGRRHLFNGAVRLGNAVEACRLEAVEGLVGAKLRNQ